MKKFLLIYVALIFSMQISCGPSAADIEDEKKRVEDSTALVESTAKSIYDSAMQRAEKIQDFKNRMEGLRNEINPILERLAETEKQLVDERAKLEEIESYHLGRSLTTKEIQVKAQNTIIDGLEKEIGGLSEKYDDLSKKAKEIQQELDKFMTPEEKAKEEEEMEKMMNELEDEMNK